MNTIRFAAPDDAAALLRIYAQYIETPITFEYTLPSEEEFARRIRDIQAVYPYLVYIEDGEVLGYAYAHRFQERAAYQWGAELSVYLDRGCVSHGIGSQLYTLLLELLRLQNVRTAYALVTLPEHEERGAAPALRLQALRRVAQLRLQERPLVRYGLL